MYTVPKLEDYSPEALQRAAHEVIVALDAAAELVRNEMAAKVFRDEWLARKTGVVTQLNENWLKPAPQEQKRAIGQVVNSLKGQIEYKVQSREQRSEEHTSEL